MKYINNGKGITMKRVENKINNFEVLRQAINDAILKNRKVSQVILEMKDNNKLSDLYNYDLVLKLRKIVNHFENKNRRHKKLSSRYQSPRRSGL